MCFSIHQALEHVLVHPQTKIKALEKHNRTPLRSFLRSLQVCTLKKRISHHRKEVAIKRILVRPKLKVATFLAILVLYLLWSETQEPAQTRHIAYCFPPYIKTYFDYAFLFNYIQFYGVLAHFSSKDNVYKYERSCGLSIDFACFIKEAHDLSTKIWNIAPSWTNSIKETALEKLSRSA